MTYIVALLLMGPLAATEILYNRTGQWRDGQCMAEPGNVSRRFIASGNTEQQAAARQETSGAVAALMPVVSGPT